MGLSSSLNTALAGLSVTQMGIGIVSQNVANADRAGYVRRQISTTDLLRGDTVTTANTAVQRLLDAVVQRQLWQDTAGAAYTSTRAASLSALDRLYGQPGSESAVDSVFNRFTASLQALQNDPSNYSLRIGVVDSATQLATRLNGLSQGVQALRTQAEASIGTAVSQVNQLLSSLTTINANIASGQPDTGNAELRDQRDRIVAELAQYIDIKTMEDGRGSLSIVTQSGIQIFDGRPAVTLAFDEHYGLSPNSLFTDDPAQRGVGTLRLADGNGNSIDAIAGRLFRSGEIAANIELRDNTLVQMQAQLDEIAAQMASAMSDRNVRGTAIAGGFTVDLTGIQPGNSVSLDYRATPAGAVQRVTLMNVAPGTTLPASVTSDPNNRVVAINFSGVPVSVQDQIDAALGPGFTATMAGDVLSLTAGGTPTVEGGSARITNTAFSTPGTVEFPFFVDGGRGGDPYTGSFENGAQIVGFAGRIVVNPAVAANRDHLVVFEPGTPQGDNSRVKFMLENLTQNLHVIGKAGGLAGGGSAASMTVADLVQRTIAAQGQAVEHARRLDEGQQVALSAVQSRFQEATKVNIDQEMALLIDLQAAYAANARIISTVKEMMDVLLRV